MELLIPPYHKGLLLKDIIRSLFERIMSFKSRPPVLERDTIKENPCTFQLLPFDVRPYTRISFYSGYALKSCTFEGTCIHMDQLSIVLVFIFYSRQYVLWETTEGLGESTGMRMLVGTSSGRLCLQL